MRNGGCLCEVCVGLGVCLRMKVSVNTKRAVALSCDVCAHKSGYRYTFDCSEVF